MAKKEKMMTLEQYNNLLGIETDNENLESTSNNEAYYDYTRDINTRVIDAYVKYNINKIVIEVRKSMIGYEYLYEEFNIEDYHAHYIREIGEQIVNYIRTMKSPIPTIAKKEYIFNLTIDNSFIIDAFNVDSMDIKTIIQTIARML